MHVLNAQQVDAAGFIAFWSEHYHYPREHFYSDNIGDRTPGAVYALFEWKNGGTLSAAKRKSIQDNFICRVHEVNELPPDWDAAQFLSLFNGGGAIWRIFWLHCINQIYPIYDQHTHRAMRFIQTGQAEEIPVRDEQKIATYLNSYRPFFQGQFAGMDLREVDGALWTFGKFIKNWPGML